MPSKKIAYKDLKQLQNQVLEKKSFVCHFPDSFSLRVLLEQIEDKGFTKMSGEDLTTMWIDNNILSPGLFGSIGPVIVLNSEKINKKVQDYLAEVEIPADACLQLFATKKITNKDLLKSFDVVNYEAPNFWAMGDYIDVFAKHFGINVNPQIKTYLTSILPSTAEGYFNALMILSSYKDQDIDLNLVKKLFRQSTLDNFALSDLFNTKNLKNLYKGLLVIENDFEAYRSFFSFIQGHIIKVIDPTYSNQKKKLSKYDQAIISASKRWSRVELISLLESFSAFEIMAKQKSPNLRDELRLNYLRH
jgi:hypothetical protein